VEIPLAGRLRRADLPRLALAGTGGRDVRRNGLLRVVAPLGVGIPIRAFVEGPRVVSIWSVGVIWPIGVVVGTWIVGIVGIVVQ